LQEERAHLARLAQVIGYRCRAACQLDGGRRVPERPLGRNRAISDKGGAAVDFFLRGWHSTREQIRGVAFGRRRMLSGMGVSACHHGQRQSGTRKGQSGATTCHESSIDRGQPE
jgi:hypothetical protein